MKLYSYFRSSTAYRVRIALNLKGIDYDTVPINLLKGEQRSDEYRRINPMGGVPALEDGKFILGQSLAIAEYADRLEPKPRLIPEDAKNGAFVWQVSLAMAADIHPIINLQVQNYIADKLGADDAAKKEWYVHWTAKGVQAVEAMLARDGRAGNYALGDKVSLIDVCIVPQFYSMRRIGMDLSPYPLCRAIERHCIQQEPFRNAAPELQPDAIDDLEPIHGPNAPLLKEAA